MGHSETTRLLEEITDEGLFERLAMAVLRQASSQLYANLAHTGMNASGKTIKSPVDGIAFVANELPPHMVTAHHTSGAVRDLRKKWLHDPSTAKEAGKTSRVPAGDVVKTLEIVQEERARTQDLRVTLALTTNREPPEDLVRDVQALGSAANVVIDIWSGSRIAHFLDTDPTGQWLRKTYLGVAATRLSGSLLHDLSVASLKGQPILAQAESLVPRDLDERINSQLARPVGFIVAESGFGKTIAAFKRLQTHVASGGFGMVLTHSILAESRTVEEAISIELKRLYPEIESNAGAVALSLCSPDKPFMILVEDINRSGQPALLIERLVGWQPSGSESKPVPASSWSILCPIWPSLMVLSSDDARKKVNNSSIYSSVFTPEEARAALLKRAELAQLSLAETDADALAESLGYDPLLVGLYDFAVKPRPHQVIGEYITRSLERLATGLGKKTLTEYRDALRFLALQMLTHRNMDPNWSDIQAWSIRQPIHLDPLREIFKAGEIGRLTERGQEERLAFRHDRVRTWILSDALAKQMTHGTVDNEILGEPYFAEVIGNAIADHNLDGTKISAIRAVNPLALFYALKAFQKATTTTHSLIAREMDLWLSSPETHTRANNTLRVLALQVLSETDSDLVVGLVAKIHDVTLAKLIARFRNGDIGGGIGLCAQVEPGTNASWRDAEIERARIKYGDKLVAALNQYLRQPQLPDIGRVGALNLAGFLGDPKISASILSSFASDPSPETRLDAYLWAGAQCGGDNPASVLDPICDAWGALPDESLEKGTPSPRERVAEYNLTWAFNKRLPKPALTYFLRRSGQEDLKHDINAMLRRIDDPDAVEHMFRDLVERGNEVGWSDGMYIWLTMYLDGWRRREEGGRQMSQVSRQKLLDVWIDIQREERERKVAFDIWATAHHPSDLAYLLKVQAGDALYTKAMQARLERRDHAAIPWLIEKIVNNPEDRWWHYGPDVWSPELTRATAEELDGRRQNVGPGRGVQYRSDYIVADILRRIDREVAEPLIVKNWDHLRFSDHYILTALYLATPKTLQLAKEAIAANPNKKEIFNHLSMHFGIKHYGHPGVTSLAQLEGLVPYLEYLNDVDIHHIWTLCNENGWFEFRKHNLDGKLNGQWRQFSSGSEQDVFAILDSYYMREHGWPDFWIKRYMDQGLSREEIIGFVARWLQERKSKPAMEYVAAVVGLIGKRDDLRLISSPDVSPEETAAIVADTRVAIANRSLV